MANPYRNQTQKTFIIDRTTWTVDGKDLESLVEEAVLPFKGLLETQTYDEDDMSLKTKEAVNVFLDVAGVLWYLEDPDNMPPSFMSDYKPPTIKLHDNYTYWMGMNETNPFGISKTATNLKEALMGYRNRYFVSFYLGNFVAGLKNSLSYFFVHQNFSRLKVLNAERSLPDSLK